MSWNSSIENLDILEFIHRKGFPIRKKFEVKIRQIEIDSPIRYQGRKPTGKKLHHYRCSLLDTTKRQQSAHAGEDESWHSTVGKIEESLEEALFFVSAE
jgi:hypothetical protein